jgi:hypothetical protein
VWTQPGKRRKNKEMTRVPLSHLAVALLLDGSALKGIGKLTNPGFFDHEAVGSSNSFATVLLVLLGPKTFVRIATQQSASDEATPRPRARRPTSSRSQF